MKVNRSEAIRNYLAKNKGATSKEVVSALAEHGIEVSASYVYDVKTKAKTSKKKTVKRKKSATFNVAVAALSGDLSAKEQIGVLVSLKKAVKPILSKLTPEQTRQSLEILSELVYD